MKILIINGNYRSGTTWLQKILDNNKKIIICSQPFFELFKLFENYIIKTHKIAGIIDFPSGILSFKKLPTTLLYDKFIKKKHLIDIINQIITSKDKERFNHTNLKFYKFFKKKILKKNNFLSFSEVLNYIVETIIIYRGEDLNKISYVGFKEGYLTSLLPLLLKVKNCKIINMIRDPREIAYSRNYSKNSDLKDFDIRTKHPTIMIGLLCKNNMQMSEKLKKNKKFLLVNFNKLILKKKIEIKKISKFLNIEIKIKKTLINKENNKIWSANTGGNKKNGNYGVNWKTNMKNYEIAVIEKICDKYMLKNNYKKIYKDKNELNKIVSNFSENTNYLKKWSKKKYFINYDNKFINKFKI